MKSQQKAKPRIVFEIQHFEGLGWKIIVRFPKSVDPNPYTKKWGDAGIVYVAVRIRQIDITGRYTEDLIYPFGFARKVDAMAMAVELASACYSQLKPRRKDGTWQPDRTYPKSSDPRRSKG